MGNHAKQIKEAMRRKSCLSPFRITSIERIDLKNESKALKACSCVAALIFRFIAR
jgi:hypothetical protein